MRLGVWTLCMKNCKNYIEGGGDWSSAIILS